MQLSLYIVKTWFSISKGIVFQHTLFSSVEFMIISTSVRLTWCNDTKCRNNEMLFTCQAITDKFIAVQEVNVISCEVFPNVTETNSSKNKIGWVLLQKIFSYCKNDNKLEQLISDLHLTDDTLWKYKALISLSCMRQKMPVAKFTRKTFLKKLY